MKHADDQPPAEPPADDAVSRIQARAGGYVAKHPAILKVLGWLGWHNPGGCVNP